MAPATSSADVAAQLWRTEKGQGRTGRTLSSVAPAARGVTWLLCCVARPVYGTYHPMRVSNKGNSLVPCRAASCLMDFAAMVARAYKEVCSFFVSLSPLAALLFFAWRTQGSVCSRGLQRGGAPTAAGISLPRVSAQHGGSVGFGGTHLSPCWLPASQAERCPVVALHKAFHLFVSPRARLLFA